MMKTIVLLLTFTFAQNTFAFNPDAITDTINGLVAELFMHDANLSFKQGDYKSAHDKFLWLAERGNSAAQYGLGTIYEEGRGVPINYTKAFNWYERAARQGNASAQLRLARIYFFGKDVAQDNIKAYAWSYVAAAQGNEIGRKNRDRLADLMAPEQITVAQELAREWVQRYNKE